ncbi:hydrogen gas-evolving membrane-bound hydrogenase subunit E [uncultured Endozoicomonas sp.]|uniref:hydrogen gas-evolving membrane-bound hydrogenase subunit E n=1 Tax=uncultured Endozoicomonas sp. TaxID=432652 RepID=UPI0026243B4E|nr:hydrogen gas-evolving membrane-bound hydrogenase subunit E [uncultured Endozoicomonas sp.]
MQNPILKLWLAFCTLLPLGIFLLIGASYKPPESLFYWSWIPSLDINFSLRLDGLSVLFASLISGVGFLIQLYAVAYMKPYKGRAAFHLYLTLFMLAMLGLVLADNLLLLFVFWELTTLTSYLLIGFNHEKEISRKNALQAMLVTGSGGLAMLAGLIMLGEMAGTYSISAIITQGTSLVQHSWFTPSLLLILLGAFTKSAQFPFHFWLPGAMAAPTPVSAYLHSSTMVKAGIYLLARMLPVYGDSALWFTLLCSAGAFTALWCAIQAYRQTDLKLMLAFSTNVILGQLVMLIGIGSSYAVTAALLLIAAHSFYKAGLFMVVGNIDKATGTREYHELAGLRAVLTISFIAALVTAASKAGLPPSFGFLSKEYLYKAGLEFGWLLSGSMLLANAIMVALGLLIIIKPFLSPHHEKAAPMKAIEHNQLLWIPPIVLALLSVVVPVALLNWYQGLVIDPAAAVMLPDTQVKTVKLWEGFNLPLLLSALTLILGIVLYVVYPRLKPRLDQLMSGLPSGPGVYQHILNAVIKLANWQTRILQHGHLTQYSLQFFIVLLAFLGTALWKIVLWQVHPLPSIELDLYYYDIILAAFLVIAAFVVVKARTLLLAVAALGTIGFLTTMVFLVYSAPDVAKTQLLVETLMVVFIAIVLRHLSAVNSVPRHSTSRRLVHACVAIGIGVSISLALWIITATPMNQEISEFYAQTSVSGGKGRNIVNVILVDFRAFDTLGEAVVVVIAGLAAVAVMAGKRINKLVSESTRENR